MSERHCLASSLPVSPKQMSIKYCSPCVSDILIFVYRPSAKTEKPIQKVPQLVGSTQNFSCSMEPTADEVEEYRRLRQKYTVRVLDQKLKEAPPFTLNLPSGNDSRAEQISKLEEIYQHMYVDSSFEAFVETHIDDFNDFCDDVLNFSLKAFDKQLTREVINNIPYPFSNRTVKGRIKELHILITQFPYLRTLNFSLFKQRIISLKTLKLHELRFQEFATVREIIENNYLTAEE